MRKLFNKTGIHISMFLLLFTLSCDKDFLDVETSSETEEALTADKSVELVNAVYNRFLQWQMSSFSWIGITSITTDDADKGSSTGDTGTDKDILDAIAFDATTISISELWDQHYDANQRITQVISRIPDFDIDNDLKNRLIGEVKFLRALIYFRLVKVFGGVPIISEKSDLTDSQILARATKEEVYQFIELDLEDAISFLPEKNEYSASDLGRATKGAAKTLLAKVSMYQNKWQEVLTLTNEVINSNQYDLTPDYEDIWKEESENNIESIFEIQAKGGEAPTAGVQGYSVTQGARGEGGWGWGFNTPTEDLENSYEPNDERKEATIIFKGETLFDGRTVPSTVTNERYNQKAYSSSNSDAWENGKNIRILRFAEVLLMNAEAVLEVGGDALTPINKVRNRAGLTNLTSVDKLALWKERRHELAFEHDRYFDLIRQGRAGEVLRAHGKNFIDGKHELFPIPQEQIDLSGGVLSQNPNY